LKDFVIVADEKSTLPSWKAVKAALQSFDRAGLLGLVQDLYAVDKDNKGRDPSPSVAEPRRPWAYSFVRAVRVCPGVRRIALLGSLATAKAIPKDVDLLVTVERAMDLTQLARAGQRLK
jgi:hypothetical protein